MSKEAKEIADSVLLVDGKINGFSICMSVPLRALVEIAQIAESGRFVVCGSGGQ